MNDTARNQIIAKNIKHYIKENKMTQKELADAIGISPSTMSDYMNLRSNPSHGVIQKIADFFGILKSDIDTTYKEINDITRIYSQLTSDRQEIVYKVAEDQLEEQNKIVQLHKNYENSTDVDLAAHLVDPSRKFTEEEIDGLKSYLSKAKEDYLNKNK